MRRQTRYQVKQALKQKIEVRSSFDKSAFQAFLASLDQTAQRQDFNPGATELLRRQWSLFLKAKLAKVYQAYSADGQLLASALIIFSATEASYKFGASTPAGRRSPGAYALQWQAIRDAKAAGRRYYDLWGVSPPGSEHTSKAYSYTVFKLGFGGSVVSYLPAQDLVLSRLTYLTAYVVGSLRRIRRKR